MRYPEKESSTVELKRELPKNDQIIRTLIGFCNQNGGKLVIGVADDGSIVGLPTGEVHQTMESIEKAIYEASSPPIIPEVFSQRFGDKTVLILEVASGMTKPYYRKSEGLSKGTYVRLGRSTVRASDEMIQELRWRSSGIDYEQIPVYQATEEDLDIEQVKTFLNERKNGGKVDTSIETLKSYHLVAQEHTNVYPTVAGNLLFGKKPQHFNSEAMIICTHFHGTSGREVVATIDCEGNLFQQFNQAFNFVLKRLSRSFTIKGPKRDEELEIPAVAVREALLNAIIHRNYHIKSPTKVAIYDNRIEVFSPGVFPGPLNTSKLRLGISYLRNPAICRVFREWGYVEKMGTGLITIFDSFEDRGLPIPEVVEGENFVKCILPLPTGEPTQEASSETDKILRLIEVAGEVAIKDIVNLLGLSRTTVRRRMEELLQAGTVERVGKTRSIRYRKK